MEAASGDRKVGTFGNMGIFSFQMNKNMTSGEGGAVVTGDERLYRGAVACHDLGFARAESGRLVFDDIDLCLWGKGSRMDELRAAILRVQSRKPPVITGAMRKSKYRIRQGTREHPSVQLRTIRDPSGNTGCFLITTYKDRATAQRVNSALRADGIVTYPQGVFNVLMTEWGLYLYFNIASLVKETSIDSKGFPWNLPANSGSAPHYEKGACPVADSIFERSILLAIPSNLTDRDELDIIEAFGKALR